MLLVMLSLIGAVAFVSLYLVGRQTRRFVAWLQNAEPPRERFKAFIVIAAVGGAIAGAMAQSPVAAAMQCHQAGEPIVACVLATSR